VTAETPDLKLLDRIADASDGIGVRVQALRWKVPLGRLTGAPRRAALRRAQEALAEGLVDETTDGSTGVVLEESFNVGVGYSSRSRLVVELDLGHKTSLIVPAPDPASSTPAARR
jgi:hypothetical protein